MASQQSNMSSGAKPHFDEHRWVIQIRTTLEEELEEDEAIAASIFSVPKTLLSTKPEAYTPQFIALGPYHHWRPELYEMERHKLTTARRIQKQLHGLKLHDLADQFATHDHTIRAFYHRYLDFTGETLTWMMLMDACFLFEFLEIYTIEQVKAFRRAPSKVSKLVDHSGKKSAHNVILRDIMMLENQIPFFVLRKMSELQCSSSQQVADELLTKMLTGFAQEVSPFKMVKNFPSINGSQHSHLLELFYHVLVPKSEEEGVNNEIEEQNNTTTSAEKSFGDSSQVKKVFRIIWNYVSSLNGGPVKYFKRVLVSKPMKLVAKVPLKIFTSIPAVSILKQPIENLFSQGKDDSKSEDASIGNNIDKPPLAEEITIPSVTELVNSGVEFSPTNGDLMTIKFDVKTITFYLPAISLDVNTEVILRNLVAYETAVVSGPFVFTRYTELMNGIIDTEEDVKLLRKNGIVTNRMKSDGEVAELWNGMSKSLKLTKVEFLDKTIEDVNKYYNCKWTIKSERFMKRYVFGCWPILTFLAAILLLLLNGLQAFCSVYSCGKWMHFADVVQD